MPKPFDPSFNPSPFDDRNKDDLNEMLREVEALNKEKEKAVEAIFDILTGKTEQIQILQKKEKWPLQFLAVKKDHKAIFAADLRRENKDLVLGFAYDWLVEHQLIRVEILREEFVVKFWNDNFEHIIV